MGEIQLHTKEQKIILDQIKQNDFLRSTFYFTGGTALSSVYLHHRYSDDLDFFSQKPYDQQTVLSIMQSWSEKIGFTFRSEFIEVVYKFFLTFSNGETLKVDFAVYPHKQVEKMENIDGLNIDSLTDIAVNKLFTISQRTDVKDFVDLYFLLDTFSLWDLREGIKAKFLQDIEPIIFASDFLKVEDFTFLPKMIKPLELQTLQSFFREKAKELGRQAVE